LLFHNRADHRLGGSLALTGFYLATSSLAGFYLAAS
jgi:hypothetical protein